MPHAARSRARRLSPSSTRIWGGAVLGISVLLLMGAALAAPDLTAPPPSDELMPVKPLLAQLREGYEVTESYAGRVISRRSSSLGFERGGQIESIRVDEGDRIEQGEVLAKLDTRRLQATIAELKAELERSQAQRKETEIRSRLAQTTAERNRQMVVNKQVSTQTYDETVFEAEALAAQLVAAEAQVKYVEAKIAVLEVDLDRSSLRAPFSGSIVSRWADEGTTVGAGEPILRLLEDQRLEVMVGVPVHATAGLSEGRGYEMEIGGDTHHAKLRTLLTEIDARTRTITAIFDLDPASAPVRVGQLARLKMTWERAVSGFWLPISALAEGRRGLWSAYALEPDSSDPSVRKVSLRELQVLHSEEDRAFVRGTLKDGELLIATGLHRVVPGQWVRLLEDEQASSPAIPGALASP